MTATSGRSARQREMAVAPSRQRPTMSWPSNRRSVTTSSSASGSLSAVTIRRERSDGTSTSCPGVSSPAMTHRLVLLRHGESEWNKLNLFTGWWDAQLTELGQAQAVAGGELMLAAGVLP